VDGKVFKVFHWHVITCTHFFIYDDPFERLPSIILVQNQVGRTLGWNWRMNPMRSFGCRGRRVFRLEGWRSILVGHQVHCRVVQVYGHGWKLWNLGRRSLIRLLLLKTSASWKITKVNITWNAFPLSSLDNRFLDGQWSCLVLNLDILFTFSTTGHVFPFIFFYSG